MLKVSISQTPTGGNMRSRLLQLGLIGILSAALFSSPALAQGNGKGKGHNKHQGGDEQGETSKYFFGERDRELITRYYSDHGSNLPPGLAKRGGNLPPGLEKHLERDASAGAAKADRALSRGT